MIAWFLWFFTVPFLFVVDGMLAAALPLRLDIPAAMCLVFGLFARTGALPGLLLCASIARALLFDGDLALHFLGMGLPVAALLPMRAVFFERSAPVQVVAAGFVALTVPRVSALFAELSGQVADTVPIGIGSVSFAAVSVPCIAWFLRRVPPLSLFVERRR